MQHALDGGRLPLARRHPYRRRARRPIHGNGRVQRLDAAQKRNIMRRAERLEREHHATRGSSRSRLISNATRNVLRTLLYRLSAPGRCCQPSLAQIAEHCDGGAISVRTVSRAINVLEELGLIRIQPRLVRGVDDLGNPVPLRVPNAYEFVAATPPEAGQRASPSEMPNGQLVHGQGKEKKKNHTDGSGNSVDKSLALKRGPGWARRSRPHREEAPQPPVQDPERERRARDRLATAMDLYGQRAEPERAREGDLERALERARVAMEARAARETEAAKKRLCGGREAAG